MLHVKAIKEVIQNGKVTEIILRDDSGKEQPFPISSIISAINSGKAEVENLIVKGNTARLASNDTNKSRIIELVEMLNKARAVYEQGTDEIMSNLEYDKLYDELNTLEQETGCILPNSPTQNVGYEVVSKLEKEKHSTPMLSLAKTKEISEIAEFLGNKEGVVSWKLDGLTVVLTYNDGKFTKGVTRGNGEIGEIVTNNVRQFKNVPKQISYTGELVLRGEAIIRYSTFEQINNNLGPDEDKYKNPRNLCSGSVRQLDSSITAKRNIEWYAFEVVSTVPEISSNVDSQLAWLEQLGFSVVENKVVNQSTLQEVIEYFEYSLTSNSDTKFDIPTDGLVFTYRDKAYGLSLGQTAKSPKHSKAFKWQDEEVVTTLQYVEWSPSRTGLINPVAVFEPVDIEGSTVSRASVHNVSIMLDLNLGYNDKIKVYKANLIIPQISENLSQTGTCEVPDTCPCCGGETEVHEDPVSGVLTLWCPNPECEAKGNRLMQHFVGRDAMNIEGVSVATLSKLAQEGIVTDPASIYQIKNHEDDIVNLDGFGEQSFNNMVDAIEKSRDVRLCNLIYALGIPNVGLATAKLICKNFNNDMKQTVTATYSQLLSIEGVGETIASSFIEYFSNKENAEHFIRLLNEVHLIKEDVSTNTTMAGITICVTGAVNIFKSRREVKDVVESLGGKLTSAVSRSTSYLVTNDTSSGSEKNRKAKEYGIPILTEQEFIDMFNISV